MRVKWTPAWDWGNRFDYILYWALGLAIVEILLWAVVLIVAGAVHLVKGARRDGND
jgi:hypothetical protein